MIHDNKINISLNLNLNNNILREILETIDVATYLPITAAVQMNVPFLSIKHAPHYHIPGMLCFYVS